MSFRLNLFKLKTFLVGLPRRQGSGAIFALESQGPQGPEPRGKEHEHWVAMRAAYQEYRSASTSLDLIGEYPSTDDSFTSQHVRLIELQGQQRAAFERYLEARMEFLEFRFDQGNWRRIRHEPRDPMPDLPPTKAPELGIRAWLPFANGKPILRSLAVALLCLMAFSVVRQQRHVRDLQADCHALRARLDQAREGLQSLERRLDASRLPQPSSIRDAEHRMAPGGAVRRRPVAPKIPGRQPSARPRRDIQATLHTQPKLRQEMRKASHSQSQSFGTRTSYKFALAPSRQFKRVGPIKVTLKAVDPKRNYVTLSIVSDFGTLDMQHLKPNQPVWINLGDRSEPLELVVDRIGRIGLEGHLVEHHYPKLRG